MRLVVALARSPGALELGELFAGEPPHRVGEWGLGRKQALEVGTAEREAGDRGLRDHPRPPQCVLLEERDLADDVTGAELALPPARLGRDRSFADHEQARSRRPRLDQNMLCRELDLREGT